MRIWCSDIFEVLISQIMPLAVEVLTGTGAAVISIYLACMSDQEASNSTCPDLDHTCVDQLGCYVCRIRLPTIVVLTS
jgi:hypothetical protein